MVLLLDPAELLTGPSEASGRSRLETNNGASGQPPHDQAADRRRLRPHAKTPDGCVRRRSPTSKSAPPQWLEGWRCRHVSADVIRSTSTCRRWTADLPGPHHDRAFPPGGDGSSLTAQGRERRCRRCTSRVDFVDKPGGVYFTLDQRVAGTGGEGARRRGGRTARQPAIEGSVGTGCARPRMTVSRAPLMGRSVEGRSAGQVERRQIRRGQSGGGKRSPPATVWCWSDLDRRSTRAGNIADRLPASFSVAILVAQHMPASLPARWRGGGRLIRPHHHRSRQTRTAIPGRPT